MKNMNIKYSGHGKRLGAHLLDMLLGGIIFLIVLRFVPPMLPIGHPDSYYLGIGMIAGSIALFLYYTIFECGKKHATPGKRAAGIKVIEKDGSEASVLDVLVRNAVRVLPLLLTAILGGGGMSMVLALIVELIIYIVPAVNDTHRAIHDFFGGTAVAEANPAVNLNTYANPGGCAMPGMPNINVAVPNNGMVSINIPIAKPAEAQQTPVVDEHTVKPLHADVEEKTAVPEFMKHARKLMAVSGIYQGAELPLDAPIVMGREQKGCNLHFPEDMEGISRKHCRITASGESVWLEDLDSTYGIVVNQTRKVLKGETVLLSVGDVFTIGKDQTFVIK